MIPCKTAHAARAKKTRVTFLHESRTFAGRTYRYLKLLWPVTLQGDACKHNQTSACAHTLFFKHCSAFEKQVTDTTNMTKSTGVLSEDLIWQWRLIPMKTQIISTISCVKRQVSDATRKKDEGNGMVQEFNSRLLTAWQILQPLFTQASRIANQHVTWQIWPVKVTLTHRGKWLK